MSCTGRPTKSVRSTSSVTGLVAVMEHQVVAVRVAEEGHVAYAGVERLAEELDALRLELGTRRRDIVHVERELSVALRRERAADLVRLPDPEARVPGPELELRLVVPP